MISVVYAVLVLGVLALIFGGGLAIASIVFKVEKDPRIDAVREALPGANCGGCGYAGCDSCAKAIAEGKAAVNACPVCSGEAVTQIAAIMGVEVKAAERTVAFVKCAGGHNASKKYDYVGVSDCIGAMKISGNGPLYCANGCLGFGSCVKACQFGAISINSNGVAEVDRDKCVDCGQCMSACPRHLIIEVPYAADIVVKCSNKDKGAKAKQNCSVSCIGCKLCEKNCPNDAIHVVDNIAVIDYTKCTSCGICATKCPRKVIENIHDNGKVVPVVKA